MRPAHRFFWKIGPPVAYTFPMRFFISIAIAVLLAGCAAPRPLPRYERPLSRTEFQTVRTTAYTHTEADHRAYSNHNALGTTLEYGRIKSAAADWSRWPAGTVFRIVQTGELYQVDDYGWALSGRNTIDLYKPTRDAMNCWGCRNVAIQILRWGDLDYSYHVLKPRSQYRHVKRMLSEIEGHPA